MSQLATKIKLYCKEKGVDTVDFTKDVKLYAELGKDIKIESWNLEIAKPTDEQLNAFESEATKLENNNNIRATRKNLYGDIGDQLDEIFKDMDAWKTRIQKIKTDNPKEE